ncbi:uncharacterized protein METZ01_LOCUS221580, partial [marine metagenome]
VKVDNIVIYQGFIIANEYFKSIEKTP